MGLFVGAVVVCAVGNACRGDVGANTISDTAPVAVRADEKGPVPNTASDAITNAADAEPHASAHVVPDAVSDATSDAMCANQEGPVPDASTDGFPHASAHAGAAGANTCTRANTVRADS